MSEFKVINLFVSTSEFAFVKGYGVTYVSLTCSSGVRRIVTRVRSPSLSRLVDGHGRRVRRLLVMNVLISILTMINVKVASRLNIRVVRRRDVSVMVVDKSGVVYLKTGLVQSSVLLLPIYVVVRAIGRAILRLVRVIRGHRRFRRSVSFVIYRCSNRICVIV